MTYKIFLPAFVGASLVLIGFASFAADARADEFGARFSGEAPAALAEPSSAADLSAQAETLQDIAPAAGDEATGEEALGETPRSIEENADQAPESLEPAAGSQADIEAELEQHFQTEVSTSVSDQGDGQTVTRDSMGSGDVRVFYENATDGRINDDKNTIGVEMKLMEFE